MYHKPKAIIARAERSVMTRSVKRLKGIATSTLLAMSILSATKGRNQFMGHEETYYNLNMSRVVQRADQIFGINPYWINEKGAKMYGPYIICAGAADRYGEIIDTSLGKGIILDTGDFARKNPENIDIATNW